MDRTWRTSPPACHPHKLRAARAGIAAANDDLRATAGRYAPVGDMHMETTCGALADPRVDSKEFAVGDLEFRADTE
ncbi:hypothetical protein GGF32_009683 [Allomyces javanicus]|nr:hypothetical protein GGF32_009683 [Allomyces javanicus]